MRSIWVERDGGAVVSVFGRPQPGRTLEKLTDEHPDVVEFLGAPEQAEQQREARIAALRAKARAGNMSLPEIQQALAELL